MSLHLIELPDELVAWLRGGKQEPAPAGLLDAVKLIEKAIDEPMECGTCEHYTGAMCTVGNTLGFEMRDDDACTLWQRGPETDEDGWTLPRV